MELESIRIYRPWNWRDRKEWPFDGTVEFVGASGKIELALSPDLSRKILAVVADELVASSRQVAEELTRETIEASAPALAVDAAEDAIKADAEGALDD